MMKRLFFIASILLCSIVSNAQCVMCKAAAEQSQDGIGAGINEGVVYLSIFPYLAVLFVGFMFYLHFKGDKKKRKKGNKKADQTEDKNKNAQS